MAALPGERAHGRLAIGPADRIEHDVDAVLAPDALERVPQWLLVVVHDLVGAVPARERELVVGRRAGDDARAEELAELHRRQSHPAGGPEHRQRLARLEAR